MGQFLDLTATSPAGDLSGPPPLSYFHILGLLFVYCKNPKTFRSFSTRSLLIYKPPPLKKKRKSYGTYLI